MSFGAFAGGLAKGIETGEAILDRRKRTAALEDELAIRKEESGRQERRMKIDEEMHSWRRQQQEAEERMRAGLAELTNKYLSLPEGEVFDPANNADHARRWEAFHRDVYLLRLQNGRASEADLKTYRELQREMSDKNRREAFTRFQMTGDVAALAPIAQGMGIDPASIRAVRGSDGLMRLRVGEHEVPVWMLAAAVTGGDPVALQREDQTHTARMRESEARVEASQASAQSSRANAAASREARLASQEARKEANETRRQEAQNRMFNDMRAEMHRQGGKGPRDEGPDVAYNAAADALLAIELEARGGNVSPADRPRIRSRISNRLLQVEREAADTARGLFEKARKGDKRAQEFIASTGARTPDQLARRLRDSEYEAIANQNRN